jgi:rifampicin phosphotransferase
VAIKREGSERPAADGVVVDFQEIDQTQVALVGGKGAHLGELSRIGGVVVPAGFCVTTQAFRRIMAEGPSMAEQLDLLSSLKSTDAEAIRSVSAGIRQIVEGVAIPEDVTAAITGALSRLNEQWAWAVRSSATAEDLPTASFAGQHDSFLNVVGATTILRHVSLCWASLFTERAVTYRLRHGFDHRKVHMAVVVQQMIFPQASGVLFTADPTSSNRKIAAVESCFGLGESLVSGLVNADLYKVRDGQILAKTVAAKPWAIVTEEGGGTREIPIDPAQQKQPALADTQVVQLVQLGRLIEGHFGCPQDIEWCLVDDGFQIVQARPITSLFPIPAAAEGNHVYLSVGHQQMMTDPMKPLGLSVWKLTSPAPMYEAGGRLFVDATARLASPASRAALLDIVGRTDPLTRDALETILEGGHFVPSLPEENPGGAPAVAPLDPIENDSTIVTDLIGRSQESVANLQSEIRTKSGSALFDFILADIGELRRILFDPRSNRVWMGAMEATWWLNENLQTWLGETNAADVLTQSVLHNITSEMGLALLDVADVIRPYPEVVAFLQQVEAENYLDELPTLAGGREARDAIGAFLDKYGMRCAGEIDITRPRWSERPTAIVPTILGNIATFEPGAGTRRFEQGRQEAWKKEQELLERVRALPGGERKAEEVKSMIDRVRNFIGYREYPKYGMVSRYFVYKQALLGEAERLQQAHLLRQKEDVFYLTFQEFHEAARTNRVDDQLIEQRKHAFSSFEHLTPPRVLTSDGEVVVGRYRRDDLPAGALAGLPASAGTVEGRARVVLDMAKADLEADDILVTAYTDPSWTPLFVRIKGLVTEVGGLMTHGAVIAREYGVPAVVAVDNATHLIQDGQYIRVHGTDGYVEILP